MFNNPKTGINYQEVVEDGVEVRQPMLFIGEPPEASDEPSPLKKWERARAKYLEAMEMDGYYLLHGTYYEKLREIQQQAEEMEEALMAQNQSEAPDRNTHPLEWVQYQNNLQLRVEEVIRKQLIEVRPTDYLKPNRR